MVMDKPAPAPSFDNPNDEFRLEPRSDAMRRSPGLKTNFTKPEYPMRTFPFSTEDEFYQFRYPNTAYRDGTIPHDLPDGLQSDGTPARHFGDEPVSHEDNSTEIRPNSKKRGYRK
jgi:hypothetical protein